MKTTSNKGIYGMKRFFYYLAWTLGIGIILYYGMQYQQDLGDQVAKTYNPIPLFIYVTLFPILIGVLLGLPKLFNDIRKNKKWKVDWIKLIAVGVPSLYIGSTSLLMLLPFQLIFIDRIMFLNQSTFTTVAGLVFGYILIDSLKE